MEGLKFINNNLEEKNYHFIIMDDGLQNPTFKKNKIVLVVDGNYGFGNKFLLPAGALRDKVDFFKRKKIDLLFIINKDIKNISTVAKINSIDFINTFVVIADGDDSLKDKNFLAFAGIAHPEKFFNTLQKNSFNIVEKRAYPDHYFFTPQDIENLKREKLDLITTKKDWVRLSEKDREEIKYLDIELKLDNEDRLKILKKIIE